MAYHPSDPELSTVRHYVDMSQPLLGFDGYGDAAVPDQTTIRIDYANMRAADPTIAPYANDAFLSRVAGLQHSSMPPATWHLGPWIPAEGTVARAVDLNQLGLNQDPMAMPLGMWMLAAITGNLTGTPLFIVTGRTNTGDVLYAVTPEEFKALPPNTYFTIALPNNANPNPLTFQSLGVIYGPVQSGTPGTYPTTQPASYWGSIFAAPAASVGPLATWLGGGGASGSGTTTTPPTTSTASSGGMSTLLVLGAAAAAAYLLLKPKYA